MIANGARAAVVLLVICGAAGCASSGGAAERPGRIATDSASSGDSRGLDPNRSLEFRPDGELQRAGYSVALALRREASDSTIVNVESHETVRVAAPRETAASTPDIVFQRFVRVPPGAYTMSLTVRDDRSPEAAALSTSVIVPRLQVGSLSSIVPVFRATPRSSADSIPMLIANPTSTVIFGRDSVALVYLEGYALHAGARYSIVVSNDAKEVVLRDSLAFEGRRPMDALVRGIAVSRVGPGSFTIAASLAGSADTVRAPLFVSCGKVYVALGEPDRVLVDDNRDSGVRAAARAATQLWEYADYGVRLVFVSDIGLERWRLTPGSELDFERALERVRLH